MRFAVNLFPIPIPLIWEEVLLSIIVFQFFQSFTNEGTSGILYKL